MSAPSFSFLGQAVIAAPSFVWPAHIAENCRRLAPLVDEVGLLFLESDACLAYTEQDLPGFLAQTGLRFHVHLPLDLPWNSGPEKVWEIVAGLRSKAAFLRPGAFVLHPPPMRNGPTGDRRWNPHDCPPLKNGVVFSHTDDCLRLFVQFWEEAGARPEELLLENTRENDLIALQPLIQSRNLGICLDLGHLLAYGQRTHLLPEIWPRVKMVHLSAPGPQGQHRSLRELDESGRSLLREILNRLKPGCILMIEVFDPDGFKESLHMLKTMTSRP